MRKLTAFLFMALTQGAVAQMASTANVMLGPPPRLSGAVPQQTDLTPQAASVITVDPANRYQVSLLYRNFYAVEDMAVSGWNGSVTPCNAGTTTQAFQDATIERVNVFRALAGLPGNVAEFGLSSTQKTDDQNAALMMVANHTLNHMPPNTWICWTQAGSDGAGNANLSLGQGLGFNYNGPTAVEGYMDDSGSGNSFVGHRRWILYPAQAKMASGDVDATITVYSSNALWVLGPFGTRASTPSGTPWPPRGYVPWQLLPVNSNNWSFSFPGAAFGSAAVSMTRNGQALSLAITEKGAHDNVGYADNTLVWQPVGVTYSQPTQDVVYHVSITGIAGSGVPTSVSYNVVVINPNDAIFANGFEN